MTLTSKGVRCGSHPRYAAKAKEMEDWILDKIDKAKLGGMGHDISRRSKTQRHRTRPVGMGRRPARQD